MGNAGCGSDGKAPGVPEERPPARPLAARKGAAANAFDQLDTDGDGFISSGPEWIFPVKHAGNRSQ